MSHRRLLHALAALALAACGDDLQSTPDGGRARGDSGESPPRDAATDAAPAGGLDDTDRAAFALLALASRTSRAHARDLWYEAARDRTYAFHEVPLYFIRRGPDGADRAGYLVHHPSPPATAREVTDADLADLSPVYRWDDQLGLLGDQPFDYFAPVAGVDSYAFPYGDIPGDLSNPEDPQFFHFLVHEAFHRYQMGEGAWEHPSCWTQDEQLYPMTVDNVALALLEHRILIRGRDSMRAVDKETALKWFLAVRRARLALPDVVVDGVNYVACTDEPQDTTEGTARYVEERHADAAGLPTDFGFDPLGAVFDASFLPDVASARQYFAFDRFYDIGSTVGHMLDAASAADWHSLCHDAKGPSDWIALAYADLTEADLARLLAEAKTAHDFPSAVTRAEEIVALR